MSVDQRTAEDVIQVEMQLLGEIMLEPSYVLNRIRHLIIPDDFYIEDHGRLYHVMQEMLSRGCPPDIVSLRQEIKNRGYDIGVNDSALMAFSNVAMSSLNAEGHAQMVLDSSRRRAAIRAAHQLRVAALDASQPLEQTLSRWNRDYEIIVGRGVSETKITQLRTIAAEEADRLATLYSTGVRTQETVTTGFDFLDESLGGYQAGDFIIWSARPNTGKTRVLLYSLAASAFAGNNVGFISLDMARPRLLRYLIPTAANLNGARTLASELYEPKMWGELEELRLRDICKRADPTGHFWLVTDPSSYSLGMLEGYCHKLAAKGCRVVAIDQAQNIAGWDDGARDRGSYPRILGGIKRMARNYEVAIVLAHQIGRAGANAPTLKDLKDTGCAEEMTDGVVILHDPQRSLIDSYGGYVCSGRSFRRPSATDTEDKIIRAYEPCRPLRIGLDKNRNDEAIRRFVKFDFSKGIKVD
jgi:replicative DNA helicase